MPPVTAPFPLVPVSGAHPATGLPRGSAAPPWAGLAPPLRVPTLGLQRLLRNTLLICGLLLVNKLGTAGAVVFFGVLTVMIARSSSAAFLALLLAGVGLMSNGMIVPKNAIWTVARLAILFVCLARFTLDLSHTRRSLVTQPYFIALMLFVAAAAICSLASGYFVHIALLKLVGFTVGLTAVLGGVEVLRDRRVDLTPWFVATAGAIVVNGFLTTVIGGAYATSIDDTRVLYFQGPFYHANACGPFSAMLAVLLFSTWLFGRYPGRWVCLVLTMPLLYFIWLSRSRTGGASLVLGLFLVFVLTYMPAARRFVRGRLTMSRGCLVAVGVMLALAGIVVDLATRGAVIQALRGFMFKYAIDTKSGSVLSSRQGLIEASWQIFLERPLFGLGFEVSLNPYFVQNATLFTAPIEKGFLPTAILEEVGIFGTVPFVLFLLTLIASLWGRRNAVGLAMLMTFLATNLGEVLIFAFGGPGLLSWMLVAAGILIGEQCLVPRQPPLLRPAMR
jgi:O-antigen ligase